MWLSHSDQCLVIQGYKMNPKLDEKKTIKGIFLHNKTEDSIFKIVLQSMKAFKNL